MKDYDEVIKAAKLLPPSAALFDLIAAYEEAEKRAGQLEKELKAAKAEQLKRHIRKCRKN